MIQAPGAKRHLKVDLRGQSYKTFYCCNLQIFVNTRVFVPGKPFHSSVVFAGKAGAYLSEAPCQGQKLTYYENSSITAVKSIIGWPPGPNVRKTFACN